MGVRIAFIVTLYILWAGVVLSLEAWGVYKKKKRSGGSR